MAGDTTVVQLHEPIVQDLREQGWSVRPHFFNDLEVQRLAAECQAQWQTGAFHRARIGQAQTRQQHNEQRQDYISWLDETTASPAQQYYFRQMELLRQAVNQNFFAGLHELEAHFAVYPPESRYQKHLDQFQGDDTRVMTIILYLNHTWQESDGGQLRLYLDGRQTTPSVDIIPRGGTLVAFWSARFWHEVLPAVRNRLSITGWFRKRPVGLF